MGILYLPLTTAPSAFAPTEAVHYRFARAKSLALLVETARSPCRVSSGSQQTSPCLCYVMIPNASRPNDHRLIISQRWLVWPLG